MNKIKRLLVMLLILCGASNFVLASTYYGPVYLQNAVTVSSTTWKTLISHTINVTDSVYSCYTVDPTFPEFCAWDNVGQINAVVKDVNALTGLKYRFLIDGRTGMTSTPQVTDNGDGSVTITSNTHALPNGSHVVTLQVAKKTSGAPTSVIDPTTGDAAQNGVLMSKP